MGKEEVVLSVIASLLLLSFFSSISGLAISDPVDNIYTSDTVYLWKPSQIMEMHSVSLTGSASGSGTFSAYLVTDDREYLIASGGAGSFDSVCIETCNISLALDKYLIRYEVNNLQLSIDSINYGDATSSGEFTSSSEQSESTPSFSTSFSGAGLGTLASPFVITNCTQLQEMNDSLGANYSLGNDIDCSDTINWNLGLGFEPIGNQTDNFSGSLDGNAYLISDLFINRSENEVGMFSFLDSATVSNITIEAYITGLKRVGTLIGWAYYSNLTSVVSNGSVNSTDGGGGTVGYFYYGRVENSYSNTRVSGERYIGGLISSTRGGFIENSYATGDVFSSTDYAGGLVSWMEDTTVNNSYATGKVTGPTILGGLVGYAETAIINNSFATGNVTASVSQAGGLVGKIDSSTIVQNSYATGTVSGGPGTGGLVGYSYDNSIIDNSYASGDIFGADYTGGLIGFSRDTTVDNSYSTGYTIGGAYVGGLTGWKTRGTVSKSYATGNTTGSGNYVGGLIGYIFSTAYIENSYARGNVTGDTNVGGLIGSNANDVNFTYSTGVVSGNSNVGGLIGADTGQVGDSYWDNETSGQSSSASGTGKTTIDMKLQPTFTGWDFYNIWNTSPTVNNGYPHFLTSPLFNGAGTLADPFIINNCEQLQFMNTSLDSFYAIANDIDCSNTSTSLSIWNGTLGFKPVGTSANKFTGSLDGGGYLISGVHINRATINVGLFGYIDGGNISNVNVTVNITGTSSTGGLAGVVYNANIDNSFVIGVITGTADVGGLIGESVISNITNSSASGNVTGINNVAGFIGQISGSIVKNSYSTGNVYATFKAGGLIAYNSITDINNSYSTSSVSGGGEVGGLIGRLYNSDINNSYATGDITSTSSDTGGLIGFSLYVDLGNSYATGNVTGTTSVGGLIGREYRTNGFIINVYSTDSKIPTCIRIIKEHIISTHSV